MEKETREKELLFLGSSGGIQVPSFHCSCSTCEEARKNPNLQRTRASVVLVGDEIILIDPTPDVEAQLERERISEIDRIFLTHWHYDHCWGLGAFVEPGSHGIWKKKKIELYLHESYIEFFKRDFAWMSGRYNLHPIKPGDKINLPDATWEAVKTTHTPTSMGYIAELNNGKKFAYLLDSIVPPPKTIDRLKGLDFIILEGTLDEMILPEGETWYNFQLADAIKFWKSLNIPSCILTHLSCHKWEIDKLVAGIKPSERKEYELKNEGLKFAYDGLRISLSL